MNSLLVHEKKYIRRLITHTVFLTTMALYVLGSVIGYIVTHPSKVHIDKTPSDYGMHYEDITFLNLEDGVPLKGWWIPSNGKKTVIFAHGYGYNREKMPISTLKLAHSLKEEGYNVLMFDFRNSGESGGDITTIGMKEHTDVLAAIGFAVDTKDSTNVALLGWSMGASSSIIAGSKSEHVNAVIADSPFANLKSYLVDSFEYWTNLPAFLGSVLSRIATWNNPVEPNQVQPIEDSKEMNTPLFLIHAKDDPAISVEESKKIEKVSEYATLWTPDKGKHMRAYKYNKNEYENKVKDFLNQNM